jgi:hypothetical protein
MCLSLCLSGSVGDRGRFAGFQQNDLLHLDVTPYEGRRILLRSENGMLIRDTNAGDILENTVEPRRPVTVISASAERTLPQRVSL